MMCFAASRYSHGRWQQHSPARVEAREGHWRVNDPVPAAERISQREVPRTRPKMHRVKTRKGQAARDITYPSAGKHFHPTACRGLSWEGSRSRRLRGPTVAKTRIGTLPAFALGQICARLNLNSVAAR